MKTTQQVADELGCATGTLARMVAHPEDSAALETAGVAKVEGRWWWPDDLGGVRLVMAARRERVGGRPRLAVEPDAVLDGEPMLGGGRG